jgi:acetylornithine deacetylase/succinyl-diaminopimelate desuccinylase-like protein
MSAPFRLRVLGRSGHASMPGIADNALVKAAPMIEALGAYRPDRAVGPEVEAMFRTITGEEAGSPDEVLDRARAISATFGDLVEPLLSLTLTPTMAAASRKRNVVPAVCDVTVDSRLLPGQTIAQQQEIVSSILGEGDYELESLEAHGGTRSPIESPLWEAVEAFVERVDPGSKPLPICVAGFTDSHWFRAAFGTVSYGFFPSQVMDPEVASRLVHSADERVPVEDLDLGVEWMRFAAHHLLSG